ncbi:kelch domain-containing protein 8B-like [Lethenteron reissneri]|uniref:kelch domain-containing protein 8B-like n=1 Tax=Lethenteron reissneri TaxID=7753 RepID=UPI002AB61455|nr:kelch domain-containing protein 8B-like [Lethenteron reissneri]
MAEASPQEPHCCCALRWKSLPPMPTPRVYCAVGQLLPDGAGSICALGGCDGRGTPLAVAEKWDPGAGRWLPLPPLPAPRAGASVVTPRAQGGRPRLLMVLGGVDPRQRPLKEVVVFAEDEGRWRSAQPLPEPSMGVATVVTHEGKVFVIGGMGPNSSCHSSVLEYVEAQDRWAAMPPMPTPRYAAGAFLIDGKIYVIGGRQDKRAVTSLECLDLETRSWTSLPELPSSHVFQNHGATGRLIVTAGGVVPPPARARHAHPTFTSAVHAFDVRQSEWVALTSEQSLKEQRADFVMGTLEGKVVVAGGLGVGGCPLASTEVLDPDTKCWAPAGKMPTPRAACSTLQTPGELYAIGGVCGGPSGAVDMLASE